MMNRFRKILSAALAGCMAVSVLMMSAGAANTGTEAAREKAIYGSQAWTAEVADVGSHSISGYYRNVYLTQDVKYKPFYSFLGNGETVSAFAVTIPGSKYNLGIYNETAQQDAGWLPNLSKGDRVLLQTANGVFYSIRASVPLNMPIGYSRMKVAGAGGIENLGKS